ncbi:MAG: molecular chaperone TorD family protein [Ardenticatenaceae bacterium]|nr:molecular chaperone TorD family protein [Ardenticatenaceae bacterium]MCB9443466.1 molecular chaperone TorD family protein [Ardenticatenaceae bacterium]
MTTEKQTNAAWQIQLTGEVLLFSLLGKILYEIPTRNGIQALVDNEVFTEAPFAEAHPDVLKGLALLEKWSDVFQQNGRSDDLFKELQVDYTNLLTGMRRLPVAPWESVYFSDERLVFQTQTMDVRAWYLRYGLEIEKLHQEPDDHIGLELIFVAHLAQLGLTALETGNDLQLEQALMAQRGFLSKHLLLWAPLWCEQMLEYAQTDFYRGLALVIRGALRELSHILEIPLPEVTQS